MGNPRYANGHRRRQLRARVLAEEDVCALCDGLVDKSLGHLDDGAPEVDEDVPVARGGNPLLRSNCRLMHRACNRWKGKRTLAEARRAWRGDRPDPVVVTQLARWW